VILHEFNVHLTSINLKNPRDVRILRASSVAGSEEMVCDLALVPLDDCPEFWVISYCWGGPQDVFYLSFSDGTYIQIS